MPPRPHSSAAIGFDALDTSILTALQTGPRPLSAILEDNNVRAPALRIAHRRAGASPSESAEITVLERLQAMRRTKRVQFDRHTRRWMIEPA